MRAKGPNAEINNWFVVVNKTKRKGEQSKRVKRVKGIVRHATRAMDREGARGISAVCIDPNE